MASKHIGNKYGSRTVLDSELTKTDSGNYMQRFLVRCDCGDEMWAHARSVLRPGGSMCRACRAKEAKARGAGGTKHPLYPVWRSMVNRCYATSTQGFGNYGGRGIEVCDRWRGSRVEGEMASMDGFHAFVLDMGERPGGTSINRIDNNGGYSPENCEWATQEAQMNNIRPNVRVVVDGVSRTIAQWGRALGVPASWAQIARKYGVPLDAAVRNLAGTPVGARVDWQAVAGIPRKERPSPPTSDPRIDEYVAWLENFEP